MTWSPLKGPTTSPHGYVRSRFQHEFSGDKPHPNSGSFITGMHVPCMQKAICIFQPFKHINETKSHDQLHVPSEPD